MRVAAGEHVLGREAELAQGGRETALQQHRLAQAADLREERRVGHVARADLDQVGDLGHGLDVARVEHLGDDREACLELDAGEHLEPALPRALERVGRGARLVGAAAQHGRAAGAHAARDLEQAGLVLDRAGAGDHGGVASPEPAVPDPHEGVGLPGGALEQLAGLPGVENGLDPHQVLEPGTMVGPPAAGELEQVAPGLEGADLVAELAGQSQHGGQVGLGEVLAETDEHGLG